MELPRNELYVLFYPHSKQLVGFGHLEVAASPCQSSMNTPVYTGADFRRLVLRSVFLPVPFSTYFAF